MELGWRRIWSGNFGETRAENRRGVVVVYNRIARAGHIWLLFPVLITKPIVFLLFSSSAAFSLIMPISSLHIMKRLR